MKAFSIVGDTSKTKGVIFKDRIVTCIVGPEVAYARKAAMERDVRIPELIRTALRMLPELQGVPGLGPRRRGRPPLGPIERSLRRKKSEAVKQAHKDWRAAMRAVIAARARFASESEIERLRDECNRAEDVYVALHSQTERGKAFCESPQCPLGDLDTSQAPDESTQNT